MKRNVCSKCLPGKKNSFAEIGCTNYELGKYLEFVISTVYLVINIRRQKVVAVYAAVEKHLSWTETIVLVIRASLWYESNAVSAKLVSLKIL